MTTTLKIPIESVKDMSYKMEPIGYVLTIELAGDYSFTVPSDRIAIEEVEKDYISKESLAGYLEARAGKLRISAGNHGAKARYKAAGDDTANAVHLENLATAIRAYRRLPLAL